MNTNKQLKSFVYDLVLENRTLEWDGEYYVSVDKLSAKEIQDFLTLMIKQYGIDDFLGNADTRDISKAIFNLLKLSDIDNKCHLADTALNSLFIYFKPTMQDLMNDALYMTEAA